MERVTKSMQAALEIAATVYPNAYQWSVRQCRNIAGTPCYPELTTERRIDAETADAIKSICNKYDCTYGAGPVQVGTTFSGRPSLATQYIIYEKR